MLELTIKGNSPAELFTQITGLYGMLHAGRVAAPAQVQVEAIANPAPETTTNPAPQTDAPAAERGTVGFIEAFQRAMGLRIDGIVGPETIAALKRLAEGRADRPASAGDIDMAVDRILSAVAKGEASAITLDDGCVYGKDAIQYLRDLVDRREAERDAARGDAAREKAAAANLATRLDKTEREWRAEKVDPPRKPGRPKKTPESIDLKVNLEQSIAETPAAEPAPAPAPEPVVEKLDREGVQRKFLELLNDVREATKDDTKLAEVKNAVFARLNPPLAEPKMKNVPDERLPELLAAVNAERVARFPEV